MHHESTTVAQCNGTYAAGSKYLKVSLPRTAKETKYQVYFEQYQHLLTMLYIQCWNVQFKPLKSILTRLKECIGTQSGVWNFYESWGQFRWKNEKFSKFFWNRFLQNLAVFTTDCRADHVLYLVSGAEAENLKYATVSSHK